MRKNQILEESLLLTDKETGKNIANLLDSVVEVLRCLALLKLSVDEKEDYSSVKGKLDNVQRYIKSLRNQNTKTFRLVHAWLTMREEYLCYIHRTEFNNKLIRFINSERVARDGQINKMYNKATVVANELFKALNNKSGSAVIEYLVNKCTKTILEELVPYYYQIGNKLATTYIDLNGLWKDIVYANKKINDNAIENYVDRPKMLVKTEPLKGGYYV